MKVNEIRIERKFNLGNFESAGFAISVSPEPVDQEGGQWEQIVDDIALKLKGKIEELRSKCKEVESGPNV